MTAPVATARVAPGGVKLENAHATKISFALDPDISFFEKSVTPPGIDGGDAIDTTTMFNSALRTKALRALADITNGQCTVAYDPAVTTQILAIVNKPTTVTIAFPTLGTWALFGGLKSFTPGELGGDGNFPEATVEFIITNTDPTDGSEQPPVYTPPVGGAPMTTRNTRTPKSRLRPSKRRPPRPATATSAEE